MSFAKRPILSVIPPFWLMRCCSTISKHFHYCTINMQTTRDLRPLQPVTVVQQEGENRNQIVGNSTAIRKHGNEIREPQRPLLLLPYRPAASGNPNSLHAAWPTASRSLPLPYLSAASAHPFSISISSSSLPSSTNISLISLARCFQSGSIKLFLSVTNISLLNWMISPVRDSVLSTISSCDPIPCDEMFGNTVCGIDGS